MNITIQDVQLPVAEYLGRRVVTFAMIDKAHQRPKGTAKVTFNRNRQRFIEGVDYFIVPAPQVDWTAAGDLDRGIKHTGKKVTNHIRGKVTLLTESGYLLLTKPFNDDLAWQVQRQLISAYFRQPEKVTFRHVDIPSIAELAAMPVMDAQNAVTLADQQSKERHGSPGSAGLHMRKTELKSIRPANRFVTDRGQMEIEECNWETDDE